MQSVLLKQLAGGISQNRGAVSRAIRELHEQDPSGFISATIEVLRESPDGPGTDFLLAILISQPDYLHLICDPQIFSEQASKSLIKHAKTLDSLVDVKLAKMITTLPFSTDVQADFATRVLTILSESGGEGTVLAALRQLMNCSNARVRSKAALLIGRLSRNPQWARLVDSSDERVVANALESLWGLDSPGAIDAFWEATQSRSNRTAGNAAVGLYLAGDHRVFPIVFAYSRNEDAKFRTTAAWVMGRISHPRLLRRVQELAKDPDAQVRKAAIKSAVQIRQVIERSKASGVITIEILSARYADNAHTVDFTAHSAGQQLYELTWKEVIVWSGDMTVEDFSIRMGRDGTCHVQFPDDSTYSYEIRIEICSPKGWGSASRVEVAY